MRGARIQPRPSKNCSLGDPFEESDEALLSVDAGVDGDIALLSSATGVSGVEVAIAGGLDEDADSLGDLRLSPRDESMSAGFPRLFSSAAAVTRKAAAGGGVSSQLLITLELLIENVVVSSNSPEFLLAPDRLVLLVVRDGEGEIRELNCSPCPSQHNLWSWWHFDLNTSLSSSLSFSGVEEELFLRLDSGGMTGGDDRRDGQYV